MNTRPPTDCPAWQKLLVHAESWRAAHLRELFAGDAARPAQLTAQAPGLRLDYSRQRLGAMTLRLLAHLAGERGLPEWREALLAGKEINSTEDRAAWHTALRSGENAEVKDVLEKMRRLASRLREERKFRRIVNLGTGGSDLGPRLLVDALGNGKEAGKEAGALEVRFAANADPRDLERALEGAKPDETLFVVVSKSFATQETMTNAAAAKLWGGKTFYAVTSNLEAAKKFGATEILPLWDWVGGRFSVWSAAGFAAMCAIGADSFENFLKGGSEIDRHFAEAPLEKNLPVLLALIGVWNTNFLGAATHAVLPYASALRLLPPYLQQLEMESNGKRVDREGKSVEYATAPVLWGMEGTVSQHSFHQLLHQGTQVVPVDFIDISSSEIVSANARAQADALAFGTEDATLPPHRQYPGNRPSSILFVEELDARNLGRLIALYEHKVFVQGVIWNLNSFDQWGVALGKQLANKILSGGK
ncbi:MAG TPA: glucose-6-phosphate isomerase [Burkholderiales bacterium]|nr:glucose-6-phosphate isomerase [Burkholderiales bacterium]